MDGNSFQGYQGKILRVDLTTTRISDEALDKQVLRNYLGGAGIGIYYLYKEVPPGIETFDPANRLIFAVGPFTGTSIGGSGGFVAVTKGPLTNGASASEANGFLGAYLRFCGFDGIILQGKAEKISYLYVSEGTVEIKDAAFLAGKDTWETARLIREELGLKEREVSISSIGVAGENLVKFACPVGDSGHTPSHNGIGAVMGSKNLKAIAVKRGKVKPNLTPEERKRISVLANNLFEKVKSLDPGMHWIWGTLGTQAKAMGRLKMGYLPINNYTTNLFPDAEKISREYLGTLSQFKFVPKPCWACRFKHCELIEITEGPFAGYCGESPEYETFAGFFSMIGNTDCAGAVMLANEADRLGLEANEASTMIAWLMESYEKGFIDKNVTGGLELKWGNVDAVRSMLYNIATRKGFGDILAEGVMRAAEHIGGDAQKCAIYTKKGNIPRLHDHRASWPMILDTVTSETGSDMDSAMVMSPAAAGLPPETNIYSPAGAAAALVKKRGDIVFVDCLGVCLLNVFGLRPEDEIMLKLVRATTGFNITAQEARNIALRVATLLRTFNIRHGLISELERPSDRYSSAPVNGPHAGKSIAPVWGETLNEYYKLMGWDIKTGKPLPDTLKSLGLEYTIPDVWAEY